MKEPDDLKTFKRLQRYSLYFSIGALLAALSYGSVADFTASDYCVFWLMSSSVYYIHRRIEFVSQHLLLTHRLAHGTSENVGDGFRRIGEKTGDLAKYGEDLQRIVAHIEAEEAKGKNHVH